ncbi:hypothetical protein [Streptomyces sp. NPDC014656]|uniref:hypothetical protein n=1 Tax=Streptomyces sp. NPDC014656 TaxID=3364878 RepID=UPI0036F6D4A5
MDPVMLGEEVHVLQGPAGAAGELAGDLGLGLSETGCEIRLALPSVRHQGRDCHSQVVFDTSHDATLSLLMHNSHTN